jgi:hypothetical protein
LAAVAAYVVAEQGFENPCDLFRLGYFEGMDDEEAAPLPLRLAGVRGPRGEFPRARYSVGADKIAMLLSPVY